MLEFYVVSLRTVNVEVKVRIVIAVIVVVEAAVVDCDASERTACIVCYSLSIHESSMCHSELACLALIRCDSVLDNPQPRQDAVQHEVRRGGSDEQVLQSHHRVSNPGGLSGHALCDRTDT